MQFWIDVGQATLGINPPADSFDSDRRTEQLRGLWALAGHQFGGGRETRAYLAHHLPAGVSLAGTGNRSRTWNRTLRPALAPVGILSGVTRMPGDHMHGMGHAVLPLSKSRGAAQHKEEVSQ
ncbi:hypothetical protein ACSNOK_23100 [Streptomyces sp. URMC 126]